MEGVVIRYNQNDGSGFISDFNGNRYSFKNSCISNLQAYPNENLHLPGSKYLVGVGVTFEPFLSNSIATANQVKLDLNADNYEFIEPLAFQSLEGFEDHENCIIEHADHFICVEGDSKESSESKLRGHAMSVGANAVVGLVKFNTPKFSLLGTSSVEHLSGVPVRLGRHVYRGVPSGGRMSSVHIKEHCEQVTGQIRVALLRYAVRKHMINLFMLILGVFTYQHTANGIFIPEFFGVGLNFVALLCLLVGVVMVARHKPKMHFWNCRYQGRMPRLASKFAIVFFYLANIFYHALVAFS